MLETFVHLSAHGSEALVHPKWKGEIAAALLEGKGCESAGEGGRGSMQRFTFSGGRARIRTYRRGGLVRFLVKDAFFMCNRPRQELDVHIKAYERGLRVPLPLGIAWERKGFWFRGRIATLELDALDLLRYMEMNSSSETVLRQCGGLIREMHDSGILHADLQVRNILVGKDGPYLIDFDNARLLAEVPPRCRNANLLRLRRSFQKNGLKKEAFETLCVGYGIESFPVMMDLMYRTKGAFSNLFRR